MRRQRHPHYKQDPLTLALLLLAVVLLFFALSKPKNSGGNERPVILDQETDSDETASSDSEEETVKSGLGTRPLFGAALAVAAAVAGVLLYFMGSQKRRARYSHARSSHGEGETVVKRRRRWLTFRVPRRLRLRLGRRRHHHHHHHSEG